MIRTSGRLISFRYRTLLYGTGPALLVLLLVLVLPVDGTGAGNALSRNRAGWDYLSKGNISRAIVQFRHSLRDNPRFVSSLAGLGRCYYESGVYEEAIDLFNRAIRLDSANTDALMGLGLVYTRMGRYSDALEFFEKVLKINEDNHDARYGIARAYYSMGKVVWAKRKIETILQMNPYHFDTLLLYAEIKAGEGRLRDARGLVDKAITARGDSPEGFVRFAEIMYRDYYLTENSDSLVEAQDYLKRALSIEPDYYRANYLTGYMSLAGGKYAEGLDYLKRCGESTEDLRVLYGQALCSDRLNQPDQALAGFLRALDLHPSDSILRARIEDFLVTRDYSSVHPVRVMLCRQEMELARNRMKKSLSEEAILYLRKSILLNPMDRIPRDGLMEYYDALGYQSFLIEELKECQRMFPGTGYQNRLTAEIMRRRKNIIYREGMSSDEMQRDVPRVLVMDFTSRGDVAGHPDGGAVVAGNLSFALEQFGRMRPVGFRKRAQLTSGVRTDGDHLSDALDLVAEKINRKEIDKIDFIVTGEYQEGGDFLTLTARLLDVKRSIIIGEFTLTSYGKESLSQIVMRSARRIYDMMPFGGRILKVAEDGIVVNLGLFDGVVPGDMLVVPKYDSSTSDRDDMRTRLYFTVKESETQVCLASAPSSAQLDDLDSRDRTYPLKKRRAKMIE